MFRKTDPQRNLFGVETNMPGSLHSRLKESWAQIFRLEVLPILLRFEERFSDLYGITGRPNFSVGRLLGLCLLQEMNKLTDQEALDAFGFDARWQYALDITPEEAYLSRRSLVEFRSRLVRVDPQMERMREIFKIISDAVIDRLNISVSEQRLDSTHIQSNIHTQGRLSLFKDVIKKFLKSLDASDYQKVPPYLRKWHEEESNGWFGLGAAERKAKVAELAQYMHLLIACYSQDEKVTGTEAYQLMVRLFEEQCEVIEHPVPQGQDTKETLTSVSETKTPESETKTSTPEPEAETSTPEPKAERSAPEPAAKTTESDANAEEGLETTVKIKKKPKGDTLQSAFDKEASYGHKGQGYSVHVAETCNNPDTPEIITDFEVHGAARSDAGKALDVLERLEAADRKPAKLYADGGYPTVPSTYEIVENHGVELIAPVNRGPMDEAVMGRDRFEFDAEGHVVSCPEGHPAIDHKILSNNSTAKTLHAIFDGDTCRGCDKLETCPVRAPNHRKKGTSPRETVGNFRLEITPELCLRDDMLKEQQTWEWKDGYKIRSGVEGTMSELKRGYDLGKLRVRGQVRVHFAVACKLIACNIKRWWRATRASGGGFCPSWEGAIGLIIGLWASLWRILGRLASNHKYIPCITHIK